MIYWVKLYCVWWSDVLNEVMCGVKWYVEWSDIVLSEAIICWVTRYCFVWDDVLSEIILCWVKCCVKWCVEWSDVLSEVKYWVKFYCWVKWCVVWSVVFCEVMCAVRYCSEWNDVFIEVLLCWVKWCRIEWSNFFFHFSDILLLFSSLFLFTSFFSCSNVSLPCHCRCRRLFLYQITLRFTKLGRTPLVKSSAQRRHL